MFQNSYLDLPLPRDARGSFSAPQRENLMASLAVNPQKCGDPQRPLLPGVPYPHTSSNSVSTIHQNYRGRVPTSEWLQ